MVRANMDSILAKMPRYQRPAMVELPGTQRPGESPFSIGPSSEAELQGELMHAVEDAVGVWMFANNIIGMCTLWIIDGEKQDHMAQSEQPTARIPLF